MSLTVAQLIEKLKVVRNQDAKVFSLEFYTTDSGTGMDEECGTGMDEEVEVDSVRDNGDQVILGR